MNFINSNAWMFAILLLSVIWGCGPDNDTVVQVKVAERVNAFRDKKIAECENALLAKAEKMADSLLMQEAINALNDSLARSRPGRPFRPPAIPPIDSASVKPLFDQ